MKKYIISNIIGKAGISCFYTALYNITVHHELHYTETDLFFLANSMTVVYDTDSGFIGSMVKDVLPYLEKETSIKGHLFDKEQGGDFKKILWEILSANHLLLVNVNTNKLKYNELYSKNINRYHTIVVYGIDPETEKIHIVDAHLRNTSGIIKVYQGTATMEEIEEATYRYMWFDFNNKKELKKTDIFKAACRNFLVFMKGSQQGNCYYGIEALRKYVEALKELEVLEADLLQKACIDINYNIKISSFNYINDYLISFIQENTQYIPIDSYPLLQRLLEIRTEWIIAGLLALKTGKSKRQENIHSFISKCESLLEKQIKIYDDFLGVLQNMIGMLPYQATKSSVKLTKEG